VGNGTFIDPLAIVTSSVTLSTRHILKLKDCLYLPKAIRNVVSIPKLIVENYEFSFSNNMCYIHFGNEYVGMGTLVNGLCVLEINESMRDKNVHVTTMSSGKSSCSVGVDLKHFWHLKLGYVNERRISKLSKYGFINPMGLEPRLACESCLIRKMDKRLFVG